MISMKTKQSLENLGNALERLEEALQRDPGNDELLIDGTIQRFEFVIELFYKSLKRMIQDFGEEVNTPKEVTNMFELVIKGGNVIKIYKDNDDKAVLAYNGVNYDLETMINRLEEHNSSVTESDIKKFEQDPEMRKMVEDSEKDIERRKVFSTQEVINKIRRER
jgi:phosphoglycolate phosphatase-like HAD superfamily hydrolase